MRPLYVDNYVLNKPILEILYRIRATITNGKLKDIRYDEGNDNIVVTCPVHSDGKETKPACSIYVGDDPKLPFGFYRCFVCGNGGDFASFTAACMDCSLERAKAWLISNYGELVQVRMSLGSDICINKEKQKKFLDDRDLADFQSWCPYLSKRGISRSTCSRFKVKYDAENRQVVFPCYDENDNLVMFARRSIDTKFFHMDKSVDKPVYCLNEIIKANINKVVITEGPFDCLSANEYGFPAIATLGTPSIAQINKINKSCITTIYTMFDNDDAGKKFTEFLKAHLSNRILVIEVAIPQGYKDINDLPRDEFIKAIETAKKTSSINIKRQKMIV